MPCHQLIVVPNVPCCCTLHVVVCVCLCRHRSPLHQDICRSVWTHLFLYSLMKRCRQQCVSPCHTTVRSRTMRSPCTHNYPPKNACIMHMLQILQTRLICAFENKKMTLARVRLCVRVCMGARMCALACMCACVCVCMCVCVCVCDCVYAYIFQWCDMLCGGVLAH